MTKKRVILDTKQASEYLGGFISPKTLSNWRYIPGKGPRFIELGGKIGYFVDELDRWLDESQKECRDNFSAAV